MRIAAIRRVDFSISASVCGEFSITQAVADRVDVVGERAGGHVVVRCRGVELDEVKWATDVRA